jgi:hypothetical protein
MRFSGLGILEEIKLAHYCARRGFTSLIYNCYVFEHNTVAVFFSYVSLPVRVNYNRDANI